MGAGSGRGAGSWVCCATGLCSGADDTLDGGTRFIDAMDTGTLVANIASVEVSQIRSMVGRTVATTGVGMLAGCAGAGVGVLAYCSGADVGALARCTGAGVDALARCGGAGVGALACGTSAGGEPVLRFEEHLLACRSTGGTSRVSCAGQSTCSPVRAKVSAERSFCGSIG